MLVKGLFGKLQDKIKVQFPTIFFTPVLYRTTVRSNEMWLPHTLTVNHVTRVATYLFNGTYQVFAPTPAFSSTLFSIGLTRSNVCLPS